MGMFCKFGTREKINKMMKIHILIFLALFKAFSSIQHVQLFKPFLSYILNPFINTLLFVLLVIKDPTIYIFPISSWNAKYWIFLFCGFWNIWKTICQFLEILNMKNMYNYIYAISRIKWVDTESRFVFGL